MSSADRLRADLPRIRIERTPANDLYLIASLVFPPRQVDALIGDPVSYMARYQPELEMALRLVRARLAPPDEMAANRDTANGDHGARRPTHLLDAGPLLR